MAAWAGILLQQGEQGLDGRSASQPDSRQPVRACHSLPPCTKTNNLVPVSELPSCAAFNTVSPTFETPALGQIRRVGIEGDFVTAVRNAAEQRQGPGFHCARPFLVVRGDRRRAPNLKGIHEITGLYDFRIER